MNEIISEVCEDEVDGGFTASALGYGIEEVRAMVRDAVRCYFDEDASVPELIRFLGH
jgi:hypothetical protein